MTLTIVGADLDGRRVDVEIDRSVITAVTATSRRTPAGDVVDARGGAVVPGLHDHHVHLHALAGAARSVRVGPPEVSDRGELASQLRAAPADADGWIRGVGYHESVAGLVDATELDALVADRPVRIQHRSGALWILNSVALDATGAAGAAHAGIERGADGRPTGRLWRADDWLRAVLPDRPVDLAAVGAGLARRGVTGVTDADPLRPPGSVDRLRQVPQRVHVMGPVDLRVDPGSRLTIGPVKVILDDDRLPGVDALAAIVTAAHGAGRPIAVHCVTRAQLLLTLAAVDDAGAAPGDRIEHGAVIPSEVLDTIRRLGLTVVTQPNFVAERGDDYLGAVDPDDRAGLYRARSLSDAGVPLAAGTDAPFGEPDPWKAVRAAIDRRTPAGATLGAGERLAPRRALSLFLGAAAAPATPRAVAMGAPADLCVLSAPLDAMLRDPSADAVVATIIGGLLMHHVQ